jgi:uncharacterized protein
MKVAVTGATGTIGRAVVAGLRQRGDEVTALTRDAERARESLPGADAYTWGDPVAEPAPAEALAGRDAVVHLLGEPVDQRWSDEAKRRIRESRELGTRNLVAGLREADPRPRVLVSQSASGYYGPRGDERVDEREGPAHGDFLSEVVVAWEREAEAASELGVRVVTARTGVVLSPEGGALGKMLTPFKLGVGGPVAGGRQYVPWIHLDDAAGALLHLLGNAAAEGPVNVAAPEPATNRELSKTLGRVLGRPAIAPVPGLAVKALYGEMSSIVTTGVRAVPVRLLELGYEFEHPELEGALRAALGKT